MNESELNSALKMTDGMKSLLLSQKNQPEDKVDPKETPRGDFKKLAELLNSPQWPAAVPDTSIYDDTSEEDKKERATGIIEILCPDLKYKSFLDFGCGEGHTIEAAKSNEVSKAIGYDTVKSGQLQWEGKRYQFLTTSFDKVLAQGPYHIILLYDVLDHCDDPYEVMSQVKQVSNKDTLIIARCHPWCSRHGGHCYRKTNKAFLHLVFTTEELEKMGHDLMFTKKVIHPLRDYRSWVKDFQPTDEFIVKTPVEDFFKNNSLVSNRIKQRWIGVSTEPSLKHGDKFPAFQMTQDFVDYKLKLK